MIREFAAAAALLWSCAVCATAAPPPGSDPNSPTAVWFQSLHQPDTGWLCCSIADCRSVVYRLAGDHLEAFIDSETFPDDGSSVHGHAPNAWVRVPDNVILRRHDNPNGEAVACWYNREIRCFVEASGV